MGEDLTARVRDEIQKKAMIRQGDLVVAGVSGGADSVCLLRLLCGLREELAFTLAVCHVEHGIRGAQSREDADFVRRLCARLDVPCKVRTADVPAYATEHGLGTEEAARKLRYRAFAEVLCALRGERAPGQLRLALAHHCEDDAETILFRMIRGSGLAGLSGMRPVRGLPDGAFCIRPLLGVEKGQLLSYLEELGQDYREDATNGDISYARNRLRAQVMPVLEAVHPRAAVHMQESARRLAETADFIRCAADKAAQGVLTERGDGIAVSIPALAGQHPAIRDELLQRAICKAAGQRKDIGAVHVAALRGLAEQQSGRSLDLPCGVRARREYDSLLLVRGAGETEAAQTDAGAGGLFLSAEKLAAWERDGAEHVCLLGDGARIVVRILPFSGDFDKIPKKTCTKWFDYDKIKQGVGFRRREPGDRIAIDAQGHHKKLSRELIDRKVPQDGRQGLTVMAQGSRILWAIGVRMGVDAMVTAETARIAEFTYIPA